MDIQTWFSSIPNFTKGYMISVFAVTFAVTYKMINPGYIVLDFYEALYNLQIWRLITNFCYVGKFSFNFLMFMLMMYNSFSKNEKLAIENKRYGEFIMMLFYLWTFILLITYFVSQSPFLSFELLFAMIYIDCKRDPDQITSIYGLFVTKSGYVPWVLLGISLLTGGNILSDLVGIVVGHLYYFLKDFAPTNYGWDLLKTPRFLTNYFDNRVGGARVHFSTLNNNQNTGSNSGGSQVRSDNTNNANRFAAFSGRGATWGSS